MATTEAAIKDHPVVSRSDWIEARKALLAKEKQHMRLNDDLARQRRDLPWVEIDKGYTFDTPEGRKSLADLFEGRSQLIVYHFMLGPGWAEGCPGCSFLTDHFDGTLPHLHARDATLICVSRAPLAEIAAFKKRMGWRVPWVSSHATDFNADFGVSFDKDAAAAGEVTYNYERQKFPSEEAPGASVFIKRPDGRIFHTYSTYARGLEPIVATYAFLDLLPKGRDEDGLPMPMAWVRHHDRYEAEPTSGCHCHENDDA
jgi:predicted dithiol-disulfide oxidoreductase (DUF899 family)